MSECSSSDPPETFPKRVPGELLPGTVHERRGQARMTGLLSWKTRKRHAQALVAATIALVALPAAAAATDCPGASPCPYASASSLGQIGDGVVRGPWGVAQDSNGTVWVTDNWDDRVEGFDSSGTSVATFGAPGQAQGQFFDPRGIAVDRS